MRLATFNVLSGRVVGEARADLEKYADAVRVLDADVLALQEVDRGLPRSRGADLAAVAAEAGRAPHHLFVPALAGAPGGPWRPAAGADSETLAGYGVALLSRHPVESWHVLRLPPVAGRAPYLWPGASRPTLVRDEPRVAVAARVLTPHGAVTVVNTHLTFLPYWNGHQLRRLVAALHALPGPLLLMGDLNMGPGRARRLTGLRPLAAHRTFPADAPDRQIDHVLTDSHPRVRHHTARRLPVSDHRALVVDVEL